MRKLENISVEKDTGKCVCVCVGEGVARWEELDDKERVYKM